MSITNRQRLAPPLRLAFTLCLAGGLSLLLVWTGAQRAQADSVVTDCTESGLLTALTSGSGHISFNCGPSQVVITLTQAGGFSALSGSFYTIDGANRITLSGGHANRLFAVQAGAALTLANLTLTDGYAADGGAYPMQGGALLVDGGRLVLEQVTIHNSQSSYAAGALEVVAGEVRLSHSLIEHNQSDYGGGIDSNGTLTLIDTVVRYNQALGHNGGGLDVGGTVVIRDSQIYSNTAKNGYGGGIYSNAALTTALTLTQSTLSSNTAYSGGGLYNDGGTATLATTTLSDN